MANWNQYIDSVINYSRDAGQSANVDKVAIVGLDGAMWTTAENPSHFDLAAGECAALANAFTTNITDSLTAGGIYAKGVKYMFLKSDLEVGSSNELSFIIGKKKDEGAISIGRCLTCFIVAHMAEGMQPGWANEAVQTTRNYLKGQGC